MQLSLFDWRPPPPAPPRAARPARRDEAERSMAAALHITPDPRKVYALACSHSFDADAERYGWLTRESLGRLISQGRALTVGTRSDRVRRSLTPAD
ncbi:hypothetical protein GCM10008965_55620 [Methylorubrum aminovorans]|uniref:hypothetical protein n=1 Tax=Methylorubrum aminovorans TaxID=269069 RepID=UPI0023E9A43C|nr:hypothetical protein [Methylorubrum aminovorans]GMA76832.1 hypothetical protein GCM10025880_32490 [Methylorubrum aminovorans]